jgi:hypothetical protein
MKRLHIIDIRFEDGRTGTVTIRDDPDKETTVSVEGLRHVVAVRKESYTYKTLEINAH